MFVQIASSAQMPLESGDPGGTNAEMLRTASDEYFGYFGGYTVDDVVSASKVPIATLSATFTLYDALSVS